MPALSGLILALSFPPLHPLLTPFVGLVPFALWVKAQAADAEGRRAAIRGSIVFGSIYFGVVFYWILVALLWFTKLAILAFAGAMILLIGVAVLFGWMLHRMVHHLRVPVWLALPIAWTAAEWFRAHWPGSLAFPWLGLGTSLTGFPELVGIAELVGARGVGFWLALVNGLTATLVLRMRAGGGWIRSAVAVAAVVAVPMAWGVWRAGSLELRPIGRVAVVQPNIPEHLKLAAEVGLDSTFASLDRLMPRIVPGSVDLVVWPEATLPGVYPSDPGHAAATARVQAYSREVGVPLVFGGLGSEMSSSGRPSRFNSAFLVDPQGHTAYRYDKHYLVPMVERIPLLPTPWLETLPYFGSFAAGQEWPLAEVDEQAYGVLICYESAYPEGARAYRLEGADALLNITNDAWYGREPIHARTTALWQHPAHMVMRAIENRMGVARAANTGISLFVDPIGRVRSATRLFEADVLVDTVYTTDVLTVFSRYGDLVGNGAAAAAALLVLTSLYWGGNTRSLDPSTSAD